MSQFSARSENFFYQIFSPIFGTKVDFFPIGTFGIPNVPNFNKFIWSKLSIKKKIKIRGPFSRQKPPIFGIKVDFLPIDLTIERECNGELVKYNVNKEVADWKGDGTLDAFFKVN